MRWLLDTNVISELRKPKPERRVFEFVASTPLSEIYISVVTFAEIRYGIELSPDAPGHTFSQPDPLIAAIAAHHGLTVVSRDRTHFDRAGVPVLNL